MTAAAFSALLMLLWVVGFTPAAASGEPQVASAAQTARGQSLQRVASAKTIVSVTFDGSFKGQFKAAEALAAQDLPGTFYINSGYLDFPAYLSVTELHAISRAGHEVGGASLYGNDLSRLNYARAKQEVCDDRSTLAQLGNQITSFSYPHGAAAAQVRSVVKACGYNSGRDVAGLYESSTTCSSCPRAETLPPKDDFAVRTVSPGLGMAELKESVRRAEQIGGWVPLVFTRVCACPDEVSAGNAVTPAAFADFVQWLADRPDSTQVRTVDQVMGGELKPVVGTPLPRVVPDPSSAIGSPAKPPADESRWAFLGAGTGRAQAIAIAAAVLLAVIATLLAARAANRRASPPSDDSAAPGRRWSWKVLVGAGGVAAVLAVVVAALVGNGSLSPFRESASSGSKDAADGSDAAADRLSVKPPAAASKPGNYVQSRVTAGGDVQVTQWVVTPKAQPLSSLELALPPLSAVGSASVAATDLVVAADQVRVATPSAVGPAGRLVLFKEPAHAVYVKYTLRGAVETSDSVPGRVLVRAATLSARYRPRVGPTQVVVTGGEVLSMGCAGPAAASLTPCGKPVDGRWRVMLKGADRTDGVVAVMNLT